MKLDYNWVTIYKNTSLGLKKTIFSSFGLKMLILAINMGILQWPKTQLFWAKNAQKLLKSNTNKKASDFNQKAPGVPKMKKFP